MESLSWVESKMDENSLGYENGMIKNVFVWEGPMSTFDL